jgi:hypothetical protein
MYASYVKIYNLSKIPILKKEIRYISEFKTHSCELFLDALRRNDVVTAAEMHQ